MVRYVRVTYVCVCACACQVELGRSYGMAEWREDLRKLAVRAGAQGTPTVFLFTDRCGWGGQGGRGGEVSGLGRGVDP